MKALMRYFLVTLLISILVGILSPLGLGVKDPLYIAISFSSVWAIYCLILLGYVFLVEGRQNRIKSKTIKEVDSSFLYSMQEWEALWKITVGRHKDRGWVTPTGIEMGNRTSRIPDEVLIYAELPNYFMELGYF